MNVTGRLAEWVADWDGKASEMARRRARHALYDTVACVIAVAGGEAAARLLPLGANERANAISLEVSMASDTRRPMRRCRNSVPT